MMETKKYLIRLSCEDSPYPGCDWQCAIEFRETRSGISVWSKQSDSSSKSTVKIGEIAKPFNIREACRFLNDNPAVLGGDYRYGIYVDGLSGWQADLITLAWIGDFDQNPQYWPVLAFLLDQDDAGLDFLADGLGCLTDDDAMDTLVSLIEALESADEQSISAQIERYFPGEEKPTFDLLLSAIKAHDEEIQRQGAEILEKAQKAREAALAPFKEQIEAMISGIVETWAKPSGWASGLGHGLRKGSLRGQIETFVLENKRLPQASELKPLPTTFRM